MHNGCDRGGRSDGELELDTYCYQQHDCRVDKKQVVSTNLKSSIVAQTPIRTYHIASIQRTQLIVLAMRSCVLDCISTMSHGVVHGHRVTSVPGMRRRLEQHQK